MIFEKDFLTKKLGLPYGYDGEIGYNVEVIEDSKIVSSSRWSYTKELIFKYDKMIRPVA